MGKLREKCKQLFQRKKSTSPEDATTTQTPQPKRARNVLRKVRRSVSRFPNDTTETIADVKDSQTPAKAASDVAGLNPVVSSVKQTTEPASTLPPATNVEQTPLLDQAASSSGILLCQSGPECRIDHTVQPTTATIKNNVQSKRIAPDTEALPNCEPSHISAAPLDSHPLDFTVVVSPPDLTDSPDTLNGDFRVPYSLSCYSTPIPKGRFDRTPETSRSPESTWLRTPKDGNSYLQLLGNPFETSTTTQTPNRAVSTCAPHVTNTEALGIFERSVGSGPEGPSTFLSLSQILGEHEKSKDEEGIDAVKNTVDTEPPQHPSHDNHNEHDGKTGDGASVKSSTPSAWERAMESREQSFQIEIEDLKDDHAAEIGKFRETIAKLEKEAESVKNRKQYVAEVAKKNVAKIQEERDNEVIYWSGLLDASESENSSKLWGMNEQLREKDQQLKHKDDEIQKKDAIIKRQNDWAVTTAAWHSQLKAEYEHANIRGYQSLQQEVTLLTALNIENEHKIADQFSQINFLRTTETRVHDSGDQLLPKLLEAFKERDQYKTHMQSYGDRYEQTLGDLMAARKEVHHQNQQLQKFNFENEDVPHLTEVADLLEKTKEAYRELEKKANECLFREQQARKDHGRAETSWKLGEERKQKQIDNLEAKLVMLENWNERLIDDLERRSGATSNEVLDNAIPFPREGLRQSMDNLRSYVSQQEAQITAQANEIHQHKVTISLHTRLLEEKDSAIHHLREEKLDAERQIEEIQTKAEEREIVSTHEMQKAVDDIDWLQTQHQNHQAQIQTMTERGLPVALIEIHQAEIQGLQQYIANLENEILTYRAQQQEHINIDWHNANAAALSERATQILRLNWENANEELKKLKNEISILRQGSDPAEFDLAEQMAVEREERQQIQERLEKSEEKLELVVADVLTLGRLAAVMWKSLEITWRRDREIDLLGTLGPVREDVNEVVGRYSDGRVEDVRDVGDEVESTDEPELEDYVDGEDLDHGLEGNSTTAARDENGSRIQLPAFRSSCDSGVTNPFASHHHQDPGEENHRSARSSSHPPRVTFTAPSASSPTDSTKDPSLTPPDDGSNTEDLPQNQEHSALDPLNSIDSYDTILRTETIHRSFDPVSLDNHTDLEGQNTSTPNSPTPNYPEQNSLIIYQPIEEVEAELMTQSAYDLLFPLPPFAELGELAEWGHESFYAPPENYMTQNVMAQEQYTDGMEVDLEDYEDDAEKEWREAHQPYTEEELDEMLASYMCGDGDREGGLSREVEGEDFSGEDGGCAL
ncbi:MAG: hypothetical protein Q9205_002277 [Flavoplaca limonia]